MLTAEKWHVSGGTANRTAMRSACCTFPVMTQKGKS